MSFWMQLPELPLTIIQGILTKRREAARASPSAPSSCLLTTKNRTLRSERWSSKRRATVY